jgi:hypothetical protein
MPESIPVVCTRCRAEGVAGAEGFEDLGDLLDFAPVPRRPRADGWTPDVQRAFIAALAVTGSERQAAAAVGKAQYGVTQLKQSPGNESFMAARERALAMAEADKGRRLAGGVHAVTAPAAHWRPPEPVWGRAESRRRAARAAGYTVDALPAPQLRGLLPGEPIDSRSQAAAIELVDALLKRYLIKLRQERRARTRGCIAEADFYVRQITSLEIAIDLTTGDGMAFLDRARRAGHGLLDLAETVMSKLLDDARRRHWAECGDPPRPEPPRHLYVDVGGAATEPLEMIAGGTEEERRAQALRYEEQHAADAVAHVAWEEAARADWAARRADGRITDADLEAARVEEEAEWRGDEAWEAEAQDQGDEQQDGDTWRRQGSRRV